jgi:hypothetical protein
VQAAQPFMTADRSAGGKLPNLWPNDLIIQALMIPFSVVMRHELGHRTAQGCLAKKDYPALTIMREMTLPESFDERIQIRRAGRQSQSLHLRAPRPLPILLAEYPLKRSR